jgi:hypothetical protein
VPSLAELSLPARAGVSLLVNGKEMPKALAKNGGAVMNSDELWQPVW